MQPSESTGSAPIVNEFMARADLGTFSPRHLCLCLPAMTLWATDNRLRLYKGRMVTKIDAALSTFAFQPTANSLYGVCVCVCACLDAYY